MDHRINTISKQEEEDLLHKWFFSPKRCRNYKIKSNSQQAKLKYKTISKRLNKQFIKPQRSTSRVSWHEEKRRRITVLVKIPLEMVLRLNTITDENQLFREFIKDGKPISVEPDSIQDRFGAENEPVERKALLIPKPAGCIPELKSVSLRQSEDPWEFYFPSCTRVERCGGCCSHKLLSCQPTEIEMINYQVIVSHYKNGNRLTYKGTEVVTVEKHNKCKCDCIMKEKDCNRLQEYRKGECRCVCTNFDAEQKCAQDNETKLWNPDSCLCECRKVTECSTGYYFSQASCQCEVIPDTSPMLRNRFGNLPPFGSNIPIDYNTESPNAFRRWPPSYRIDKKK